MDNRITIVSLYDYYGELLTEKQKEYIEEYYFNNLSLSEVAENSNISRNAVHKQLKEAIKKLEYYEEKLKLMTKKDKILKLVDKIDEKTKDKIKELI